MSKNDERHSTFHEQWHLVENLMPVLRADVHVHRQSYWGALWYILSEPDSNTHFRLAKGAYTFVSRLDGELTVQEIWDICQEIDDDNFSDDAALTQGEVIALLGRLHGTGLITVDMPADTDNFLRRKQERQLKKIGQTLSSFLFLRIPLLMPDAFFTKFQFVGSLIFRPFGIVLWFTLFVFAFRELFLSWDKFVLEASQTLHPANLFWLYLVVIVAKIVHECGHAFACKYFSRMDGRNGDVHSMGIMFLLFAPVPYIDVSSSVQIRSRFSRAFIALAGVYSELFLAFISCIVWANTTENTSIHLLARNCVIITSVTTLLFNLNPLLRFDGYFVFSDIFGMPNLYQRSQAFMVYLFKRYILGINKAQTVVQKRNEQIFYPFYAIAAFIYRIFITIGIFIVLEDNFEILGIVLTLSLLFIWFVLPLIKGLVYLIDNAELTGLRAKTLFRFAIFISLMSFLLLAIPVENSVVVEGVVESREQINIFAQVDGTLLDFMPTDEKVEKDKSRIVKIDNAGLMAELEQTLHSIAVTKAQYEYSNEMSDTNSAGMYALEHQSNLRQFEILLAMSKEQLVFAPVSGIWVAPDLSRRHGKWVAKGDVLGSIYNPENLRLRALVDQFDAARLFAEHINYIEFSVSNRMDINKADGVLFSAKLENVPVPAGRRELFHPALAIQAGGQTQTVQNKEGEILSASHFFEISLLPEKSAVPHLLSGQKVLVRLVFDKQAIGLQWARRVQQFFAR